MSKDPRKSPPDQEQRDKALDPTRSILVQAPAGAGKTTLLSDRFLALLSEVDDPTQVVAITFTIAAAAEMRNRILDKLREAEPGPLARRVLERSQERDWKLLELPAQLRISTIDSFCRELALRQPLLSGLGGGLNIAEQPDALYRRAATRTLERIGNSSHQALSAAIETLLGWRDNNWQELEDLLVVMLRQRDRWMHGFVLGSDPDWVALRDSLERPFRNAVRQGVAEVSALLDHAPGAREEVLLLARFACAQPNGEQHQALAELTKFPVAPFVTAAEAEEAMTALDGLANLALTKNGTFRERVDKNLGFPLDRKPEKARILNVIGGLAAVPGLEAALAAVRRLPPLRYTEEEWALVQACFTLLRHAAGQLKVAFAEAGTTDFVEVAQAAQAVLRSEDGNPSDAAWAVADGIRHLLVDEFQDTSRKQHRLLASLIAAWPERTARTCFAVGDPMQSIYSFREADAELFARVRQMGLEISHAEALPMDFVPLTANFRTTPKLVSRLNQAFSRVFDNGGDSGVSFSPAKPARPAAEHSEACFGLHLAFAEKNAPQAIVDQDHAEADSEPQDSQFAEIVALIRSRLGVMEAARAAGEKYRIAVLGRARKSLAPIAEALRRAAIPFRAVKLEKLAARQEVLDALALARALLHPWDRISWLGVLRAPWCGLTLEDLHLAAGGDDAALLARPIPELLGERVDLLSGAGRAAVARLLATLATVPQLRANQPNASLGTRLEQVWVRLGGPDCCDRTARSNLDLLWSCLDRLPDGEQDLLGPALDAALDKLTALPDPAASSDCGVQLMTIHESKGLEFEVAIVPDLHAGTGASSRREMLSWLERGLTSAHRAEFEEDPAGVTEFLVAPLKTKGGETGKAKAWVDGVLKRREEQEARRILYVAATRAREELHLFARLDYKVDANGECVLFAPSTGLLATAWPALEEEARAQFALFLANRSQAETVIETMAASARADLSLVPPPSPASKPAVLRRLPEDYQAPGASRANRVADKAVSAVGVARLYTRHEGGLVSRALGTAVHALLEELTRLRATADWPVARAGLGRHEARIAAQARALGITAEQSVGIASDALRLALGASHDAAGGWILSPHAEAASEVRWVGLVDGVLASVRVDRVFQAGLLPLTEGSEAWWVVDYKTAHGSGGTDAGGLRGLYAGQVEAYARVLRNLHGADAVVRAGLYYPRMAVLDWWEL